MNEFYLGIDTSNYKTSVSIFCPQTGQYKNIGKLLDVKQGELGLRQSDAIFKHISQIYKLIDEIPKGLNIKAVCVSTKPRDIQGSYMPCFIAGESIARSIASVMDIPVYTTSHQQNHIVAAAFSAKRLDILSKRHIAWHLSGGTTEVLLIEPDENKMPNAKIIGGTSDISAGQLIDRVGVMLGLKFPCGNELEKLSEKCTNAKAFNVKVKDGVFSLSGMQNKAQDLLKNDETPDYIAQFVISTISKTIIEATKQIKKKYDYEIICAGGVMSNKKIKQQILKEFSAVFALPELSGDNAVGCAIIAAKQNGESLW